MALAKSAKVTALHRKHIALGARIGNFAGFEMPMWYGGIKGEHAAVRTKAGIFDLSHMGEIFVRGPQAFDLIQYLTCNDIRRIGDGQCQYTLFPTLDGGVVDDLIAYQVSPEEYMLVVNASNIDKDLAWIMEHNRFDCEVEDLSDDYSLVAIQGPRTNDILQAFGLKKIASQEAFTFRRTKIKGKRIIVAGTGYTGERGFEIITENENAEWLWDSLMQAGEEFGLEPVGLGARDTLRLEMAYSLYGHELESDISVLEANLAWTVRLGVEFLGRDFLLKQKEQGLKRIIVGCEVDKQYGAPRASAPVFDTDGNEIGEVTSGSFSPSLEKGIALALVPPEFSNIGRNLKIEIRGKPTSAMVCETPFYNPSNK